MRVLDFTKDKLISPIDLGRNTAMIMCFTPKVILFENSLELDKFTRVWEDLIIEYLEENQKELDPEYELNYYALWYVDDFEGESWLFDEEKYKSRNLKLVADTENKCEYENSIMVKFGVGAEDIWTDMETLKIHIKLVELLFNTPKLISRCKDDTVKMFRTILDIWKEDLNLYEQGSKEYFKVYIEEEI